MFCCIKINKFFLQSQSDEQKESLLIELSQNFVNYRYNVNNKSLSEKKKYSKKCYSVYGIECH